MIMSAPFWQAISDFIFAEDEPRKAQGEANGSKDAEEADGLGMIA